MNPLSGKEVEGRWKGVRRWKRKWKESGEEAEGGVRR